MRKRDRIVTARLTEAEHAALLKQATLMGMSVSDFIRYAIKPHGHAMIVPPYRISTMTMTSGAGSNGMSVIWK